MEAKSILAGVVLATLVLGTAVGTALLGAEFGAPAAPADPDVDGPIDDRSPDTDPTEPLSATTENSLPTFEDSADFVEYVESGRSDTSYVAATGGTNGGDGSGGDTVRE